MENTFLKQKKDISVSQEELEKIRGLVNEQGKSVQDVEDVIEERAKIKQLMQDTYKITQEQVTEHMIDSAIDAYFAERSQFKAPQRGLQSLLATGYVMRNWIATRLVIPAAVIGLGAYVSSSAIKISKERQLIAAETTVEEQATQLYAKRNNLENSFDAFASNPDNKDLSESEMKTVHAKVVEGKTILGSTLTFFDKYVPDGNPKSAITQDNYKQAQVELNQVNVNISSAEGNLGSVRDVYSTMSNFRTLKQNLDSLLGQVKAAHLPQSFEQRANTIYELGLKYVENRGCSSE